MRRSVGVHGEYDEMQSQSVLKPHLTPSSWEMLTVSDCNLCALMNMVNTASETQMLLKQLPLILRQNIIKARGDLSRSIELNNASLPFDKFDETRSKKLRSLVITDRKVNGESAGSGASEESRPEVMGASGSRAGSPTTDDVTQVLSQRSHVIVCFPKTGALNYMLMNGSKFKMVTSDPPAGVTPPKRKGKSNEGSLQSDPASAIGNAPRAPVDGAGVVVGRNGKGAAKRFGKGKEKATTDQLTLNLSSLPTGFTLEDLIPPLDDEDPGIPATVPPSGVSAQPHRHSWPAIDPRAPPFLTPGFVFPPDTVRKNGAVSQVDAREDDYDPEKFTRFANFLVNMEPLDGLGNGLSDTWREDDMLGGQGKDEEERGERENMEQEVVTDEVDLGPSLQALTENLQQYTSPAMSVAEPSCWELLDCLRPTSLDASGPHSRKQQLQQPLPHLNIPEVPMSWLVDPSEVMRRSVSVCTTNEVVLDTSMNLPCQPSTPVATSLTINEKNDATHIVDCHLSPSIPTSGSLAPEPDIPLDLSPDTLKLLLPFGAPSPQEMATSAEAVAPESQEDSGQMFSPVSRLFESFAPPDYPDEGMTILDGGCDWHSKSEEVGTFGVSGPPVGADVCFNPLDQEVQLAPPVVAQGGPCDNHPDQGGLTNEPSSGGFPDLSWYQHHTGTAPSSANHSDKVGEFSLISGSQVSPGSLSDLPAVSGSRAGTSVASPVCPMILHSDTQSLHSVPPANLLSNVTLECDGAGAPTEPSFVRQLFLSGMEHPPSPNTLAVLLQQDSHDTPRPPIQLHLPPTSVPTPTLPSESNAHRATSLSPHLLPCTSRPSSLRPVSPLENISEGVPMEVQGPAIRPTVHLEGHGLLAFEQYQSNSPIPSSPSIASISSQSSMQDLETFFDSSDSPSVLELCELLSESPNVQQKDFSHMKLSESDKQQLFKAAEIIQNAFRTYKARRQTKVKEKNAALTIENYYKHYREVKQRKDQAARRIQQQYRVYKYRVRELNRAALFIQQMYRFHHRQRIYHGHCS